MQIQDSIQCTSWPLDWYIKNGAWYDFRLDEARWAPLKSWDIIELWEDFSGWDTQPSKASRRVKCKIEAIYRAKNFKELCKLLESELLRDGYESLIQDLRKYWSEDKELSTWVLAMKIITL